METRVSILLPGTKSAMDERSSHSHSFQAGWRLSSPPRGQRRGPDGRGGRPQRPAGRGWAALIQDGGASLRRERAVRMLRLPSPARRWGGRVCGARGARAPAAGPEVIGSAAAASRADPHRRSQIVEAGRWSPRPSLLTAGSGRGPRWALACRPPSVGPSCGGGSCS